MPNEYINGLRVVQDGQKSVNLNLSNARRKTYSQLQNMTDEQKKGVIIVEDYPVPEDSDEVSVTGDGEKTYAQLLNELHTSVDVNKVSKNTILTLNGLIYNQILVQNNEGYFSRTGIDNNLPATFEIGVLKSNSYYKFYQNNQYTNKTNDTAPVGTTITLYYDYYKNLDIHTEYLAKNCILTGGGNVEDDLIVKVTYTETETVTINSHDVHEFTVTSLIPDGYEPMSITVVQGPNTSSNTYIISSVYKNTSGNWRVGFYNWWSESISIKPIINIFCKKI